MEIFRGYYAKSRSNFVIESGNPLSKKHATRQHYRAQRVFKKRLNPWLRKHGVTSQKPLHELRKEFGSQVNKRHGLVAAKDVLRHSDIATTAAHYVDSPPQATSGLGALFRLRWTERSSRSMNISSQTSACMSLKTGREHTYEEDE